jgi:hypothetical protein
MAVADQQAASSELARSAADALWWPLSLATLGPLPREDVGAGSGFYNLTRQLGGSFGIAVLTLVLDHQRAVHRAHLVEALTPIRSAMAAVLI